MSATDIVKWYNGEEALNLPAKMTNIAIVGNGNVAADVARVLLTDPRRLSKLDIAQEALDHLSLNPVKSVTIFGRRSPWDVIRYYYLVYRLLSQYPNCANCLIFQM